MHKDQQRVQHFYGNSLFASEAMINLCTTSRKCDLESLMYVLGYVQNNSLPILDAIHSERDFEKRNRLLEHVRSYRQQHMVDLKESFISNLPDSLRTAFAYV